MALRITMVIFCHILLNSEYQNCTFTYLGHRTPHQDSLHSEIHTHIFFGRKYIVSSSKQNPSIGPVRPPCSSPQLAIMVDLFGRPGNRYPIYEPLQLLNTSDLSYILQETFGRVLRVTHPKGYISKSP